jgi:drug/metabolite transporter (DMT)-like permease
MPGVAVVLGWWVLHEHIGLPAIAGGALIVLGVAMVVLGSRTHPAPTVSS